MPRRLRRQEEAEVRLVLRERRLQLLRRLQARRRLPPVDLREEVLSALPEELVGELPPICHYLPKALQQQKQQIKPKKTFSIFFLQ